MRIKCVLTRDKFNHIRIFRFIYSGKTKAIKLGLQPRVLRWENEPYRGWNITFLGIRITYENTHGSGYIV